MESRNNHRMNGCVIKRLVRVCSLLAVVWMSTCMLACGTFSNIAPAEDESPNQQDENLIVVGVSQLGSESVWRTANTISIQNEFTQENGYFLIFNNARQKQENQIKAIRGFISQRVDYIIFSPVEENGYRTVLEEAKEAGIPVILMDRTVNASDFYLVTSWVGTDFTKEGVDAAKWLEEELMHQNREDDVVNIVILKGTKGSSSEIGRSEGFDQIAKTHSNWIVLEEEYADFTAKKGEEVMSKLLKRHTKIDVVISQNDDMTFGALSAIRKEGKTAGVNQEIIMVSFDAVKDALELVMSEEINVAIECNPLQAPYVASIIRKMESGEEVEKQYFVKEQVFTKENVSKELINSREY